MRERLSKALLIGSLTFVIAYVALMTFAMLRFSYYSGPLPSLLMGIPIPLLTALIASAISFQRGGS
jgi:hypothetical protein